MQLQRVLTPLRRALAPAVLLTFLSFSPMVRGQQPGQTQGQTQNQPQSSIQNSGQDGHIVSPGDLQQQMQAASTERQKNIDTLTQFVSTPEATRAMQSAHVDPVQVKTAIPQLSDAELADLSARAAHAQSQFSAGFLGIGTFLLIIILIVVIIIVVAVR